MNCIITLNINNYLCNNARQSMLAASKQWGCDFYEITENLVGNQNVCFNKLVGIKKYYIEHPDIDKILYIDADVLIRDDAPNPFTLFLEPNIYAARDAYDFWDDSRLNEYHNDVTDKWLYEVHQILRLDVDISNLVNTCSEWFFNAGVFIITPSIHMNEIDYFIQNIPTKPVSGRIEQAMWNYILKVKNKVSLFGQEWNRLNPIILFGSMNCYIYHFTGDRWKELKEVLPIYNWRTFNFNYDDITFFYIVGGNKEHYDNLDRSIRSLKERIISNPKIVVLEYGTKLISRRYNFYNYISLNNPATFHNICMGKYLVCQLIDTKYGIYIDNDTIFVNNVLVEYINQLGIGDFGISNNWWVKTIDEFVTKYDFIDKQFLLDYYNKELGLMPENKRVSAGVFMFKNTSSVRQLFSDVISLYNKLIDNVDKHLCDELILTACLKNYSSKVILSGAINHTCNFNELKLMPLMYKDGIWQGKNEFDVNMYPILTFHCNPYIRDPLFNIDQKWIQLIKNIFYI